MLEYPVSLIMPLKYIFKNSFGIETNLWSKVEFYDAQATDIPLIKKIISLLLHYKKLIQSMAWRTSEIFASSLILIMVNPP